MKEKKKYKRRELRISNTEFAGFKEAARKERKLLKPGHFNVFEKMNWLLN